MAFSELLADMESFPTLAWVSPALTAVAVILVALFSGYRKSPKGFNVPTLGEDSQMRYVQEADVLLREGYEKVSLSGNSSDCFTTSNNYLT